MEKTYHKIKALCKERGTSIRKVEQDCGIANGTIGRWRTRDAKVTTLAKIADFFGVTLDELTQ